MKMETIFIKKAEWRFQMQEEDKDPLRKVIRIGKRMTVGREAILNVISRSANRLSAEEIYLQVHEDIPSIGLTSVYRTMELLVNMGIVARFDFGDGRVCFELMNWPDKESYHHHLVCPLCNTIIEYDDFLSEEIEMLQMIQSKLSKKFNFSVMNHLVQYYGLCSKCSNKRWISVRKQI